MTFEDVPAMRDIGPLAAALAKAQSAYPPIPRDREVEVQTRTGGKYRFKYAPLDTILNAVRKPLADNGLAVTQLIDGGDLTTMLLHESGAYLIAKMSLPHGDGTPQALGSAITYLRRYSLQAMLGIAAEEDDDAQAAKADGVTTQRQQPRQQPTRPTLAAVVAEAAPPESSGSPREPRGDAPAPGAATSTAPAPEAAPVVTEEAPPADNPEAIAAARHGITWDEFRNMMREQHVLSGQVTVIAKKRGYEGLVKDLTDDQRYDLWEAVLADLKS